MEYFSSIRSLAQALEVLGQDCTMLVQLLESEQERGRFSYDDINAAAATLGFGADGPLGVEYGSESDVPDEFIENAWKECVKRSWHDYLDGTKLQTEATKALKIIADARGSRTLQRVWEHGKRGVMSPDKAYDTLEVPKDVDEEMLITVFSMRASYLFLLLNGLLTSFSGSWKRPHLSNSKGCERR